MKYSGNATYRQGNINNSKDLLIGGDYFDSSKNFVGSIDDVKMYNRVVSHQEIKKIPGTKKKWNFIMYMSGDSDLERNLLDEFDECEKIDFEEDINIIALMDRSPQEDDGYDNWSGARLMRVRKEPIDNNDLFSEVLKEYGDFNMGDSKNLEDLIIYSQNNFPADQTVLILNSHGAGINGVCFDDTSNDKLTISEIKQALSNAQSTTGKGIEILCFDACLMQAYEMAYELSSCAVDYIVGSESQSIAGSFEAYEILSTLTQNTNITTEEVLDIIKDNVAEWTWSAVKTKGITMESSYLAFSDFAQKLLNHNNYSEIKTAYSNSKKVYSSGDFYKNYLDLISFAKAVANSTTNQELKASAEMLITELKDLQYFSKCPEGYYGISIFFPYTKSYWTNSKSWYKNDFSLTGTKWDEFLDKYWGL